MNETVTFEEIIAAQNHCIQLQNQHWLQHEVFSFQFWLLVALLIIPWLVWWKIVDKKRFLQIFLYGFMVMTVVTFLDEVGCQLNLWEYRVDIEPLFPRLIPMNFTMLPICYMVVYQYCAAWKPYLTANLLMAALFSFVGEPVFIWLDIYELIKWKHIYSFPLYFLLAVGFKAATDWALRVQRRAVP